MTDNWGWHDDDGDVLISSKRAIYERYVRSRDKASRTDTTEVEAPKKTKAKTPKPIRKGVRADTIEYEAVCAELGFAPPEVTKNRVLRVFKDNRLPIYDKGEVHAYMTSITPSGMRWGWQGLCHAGEASGLGLRSDGGIISGQYEKLVPIHILKRVRVVRDLFIRENPEFYVTDYAVKDPDPFVKVVLSGGVEVIFGMWDEPGFGDLLTDVGENR